MQLGLTVVYILTTGLLAGFFFAYWCSVMIGLRRVNDQTFVAAMQNINAVLPNARFGIPFFVPAPLGLVTSWLLFVDDQRAAGWWLVAGTVFSGFTFVITAARNVPLNNRLADAGVPSSILEAESARTAFEVPWIRWNNIRTATSFLAFAAGVIGLIQLVA